MAAVTQHHNMTLMLTTAQRSMLTWHRQVNVQIGTDYKFHTQPVHLCSFATNLTWTSLWNVSYVCNANCKTTTNKWHALQLQTGQRSYTGQCHSQISIA